MAKIGRNQTCPCGSGKKYKQCHGKGAGGIGSSFDQASFQRRRLEIEAENAQREKQQGLGRPIISTDFKGQRVVAVCNRLFYSSKWKTFHDFLRDYIFDILGRAWIDEQIKKPAAERHQIIRWYDQAMRDARAMAVEKDGVFSGPMTGAQRAFLNLAYNLYLIEHHSDSKKAQSIRDSFVVRLKSSRTDDFIGKLFEAYASAAFLKAGFQLDYENEHDGRKSHVEFVATYPATGKKFAVEVKARNRLIGADGPMDEAKRLRVSQKLTTALRKSSEHARIVFIEVNIPDVVGHDYAGTWVHAALDQIKDAESFIDGKGELYPPAYVVVTNHAYHNNLEAVDVGLQAIADGYRIPNFGPRSQINRFKDYLENLEQHKEILALFASLKAHSHIPVTFDGEIPEFAFGKDEEYPRLRIGHTYLVPNGKGEQILGVLEKAIVVESWKKAQGIYRLENGQRVLVAHELTERELSAWKRHPKTFFGQYEEEHDPPTNWLEMAEFLYRSYSHTSKERLLEFMAAHEDIQSMAALSQEELAVIYCESMAWSIWNDAHKEPVDDQK